MAFNALIPFSVVFAAVDRKILIIMVKSCRHPAIYTMAGHTICWKSRCNVVGVIGRVVIAQVAAYASAWCIVVVAVVASRAIIGNGRMCTAQNPIVVVNRESCRIPIGVGGMAHRTIRWNAKDDVVGVGAAVEIGQVTADAGVRGVGIVALVASVAIVGDRNMPTSERIERIVVERGWNPGIFRMAVCASDRELRRSVVGV